MNKRLILIVMSLVLSLDVLAAPTQPARNKDGSIVTGVLTAAYDPANTVKPVFPFPFNLLFLSSKDMTLDLPPTNPSKPTDPSDPRVALNSLDGFSTVEKWTTTFIDASGAPGNINPASVVPGQSVRVLQVTSPAPTVPYVVSGVVKELTPGVDYTAVAAPGGIVAIIPLKPLPEFSNFLAVLTNGIRDSAGNDATPSQTYFLTKRRTPWVDANGKSTYSLIPDANARALEPQRQITQSMEFAAAAVGVPVDDIVLSWTVRTQSISPTLRFLSGTAQPADTLFAPTGSNTSIIGGAGLADISIGVISLPYYSGIPSAANPIAFLTNWWKAAPGAYMPPFDKFGLDPTSTNITLANPIPVRTGTQTVPLLVTTPGMKSGLVKPAAGWPIVLYPCSLTRNRTDALVFADSLAAAGFAVVAIDQPLHGVVPDAEPSLAPFYIENTPFGDIANERTFDADLVNNQTGAPGPDGLKDASGTHSFNLLNLQVARDNLRQADADVMVLAASVASMDIDNDGSPDFNANNISLYGFSAGAAVSGTVAAIDPLIKRLYLNAAPGSIMRTIVAGAFGGRINAALASAGIVKGTVAYETFLTAAQTLFDSADSINYTREAAAKMPVLLHEVIGDLTVPNVVAGAPLAGTEAQIALMGLKSFSTTQVNLDGVHVAARFLPPAIHSSLIDPRLSPATTAEMQIQAASFVASSGTFVQVTNPAVMQPVIAVALTAEQDVSATSEGGSSQKKSRGDPNSKLLRLGRKQQ